MASPCLALYLGGANGHDLHGSVALSDKYPDQVTHPSVLARSGPVQGWGRER